MKKLTLLSIISLFFLSYSQFTNAQIFYANKEGCTYYHQDNCPIPDFSFFYNGQSKSALFKPGQTSELHIIVYEGEDYFISVCAPKKVQPVRMRIMEDDGSRTLLFDNAKQSYVDTVKFKNETTKRLIIEVSIPEVDPDDPKADPNETKCVGVLIASRRTETPDFISEEEENTGF